MIFPDEFEKRMKHMLRDEYGEFVKAMEESPIRAGIRINPLKEGSRNAVMSKFGEMENVPWCTHGFYADKKTISGNHPYHLAGLFYFQEPSAMSVVSALPVNKNDRILDLCAAPGGKSTQAGALLGNNGLLVANDISRSRANILSDNIERFGIKNAVVTNEAPDALAKKYPRFFDKIIIDAPCSGEGMFRKEPQSLEEWSREHTISCARRQKRIIDSAVKMLKAGGFIVYSTCTFAPEENEQICAYILDNYNFETVKPYSLDMLRHGTDEWSMSPFSMDDTRRIFPHCNKGEGHFIALLKNLDNEKEIKPTKIKARKSDDAALYREFENEFLNLHLTGCFRMFGENLYLLPEGIDIDKIKVVRAGLHLGKCRKNRFEPSRALCLALTKGDIKNHIDLSCSDDLMIKYISGETIPCGTSGWCAVCADGYPIGWGKASGGVLKNHFPKYLRIKNHKI